MLGPTLACTTMEDHLAMLGSGPCKRAATMSSIVRIISAALWLIALAACTGPAAHNGVDGMADETGMETGFDGSDEPGVTPPQSNVTVTRVKTASALVAALAAATPGSVVFVENGASIDLTGMQSLVIPAQVTLAGGGGVGGTGGPLLYTTQLATSPLFRIGGPGVRITGLRLRGPDSAIGPSAYYQPTSMAILAKSAPNVRIDHCELWAWSYAAVQVDYTHDAYIHHNSMHHNRRNGLGYAVILNHDATALIERNTFDYNRHAIAGTGLPGVSYEARYNYVGPNRNGHAFDMHGENEAADNGSPYAGDVMRIHHNTFAGTEQAIVIRGRPKTGAYITDNCFGQTSSAGTAIIQRYFTGNLVASGNTYAVASGSCHTPDAPARSIRSDVNGDGYADVVTLVEGTVHTFLGSPSRTLIAAPPVFAGTMGSALHGGSGHLVIDVADVDGDTLADLVTAHDSGAVYVYRGAPAGVFDAGITSLVGTYPVATATTSGFDPIAVADVDGDGRGDLVSERAGSVYVHPGHADGTFGPATESFAGTYASARLTGIGHLAIDVADVTGDGRADLVTQHSSGTAYVFPGLATRKFGTAVASFAGTFAPALADGSGFEPIGVADVTGDGRADLVALHTNGTANVYAGTKTGAFGTRTESFAGTMATSLFGGAGHDVFAVLDVDGDGHADLVTAGPDHVLGTYRGSAGGTFSSRAQAVEDFLTVRTTTRGYEAVVEKPRLRRLGCDSAGCF